MSRKQPLCRRKAEKSEKINLQIKTEEYSDSSTATTALSSPTELYKEAYHEFPTSYVYNLPELVSSCSSFDFTDEELSSLVMEVLSDDC
jgi:hypothetical protein